LETQGSNGAENIEKRQQEESELLELAWHAADLRVVVKRPIKAPLLGQCDSTELEATESKSNEIIRRRPSYSINGSINRWDIYVKP
jgi:hypothetical protein